MFWKNWFFGKKRDGEIPQQETITSDIPSLIKDLRLWQTTLNMIGQQRVTEVDEKIIKRKENKLIEAIPDKFQKEIIKLAQKYKFDITEFAEEGWQKKIKDAFENIASYLSTSHPLNFLEGKFPPEGEKTLFWMLEQAKKSPSTDKRYQFIIDGVKKGVINDYHFPTDEETLASIFLLLQCVLFSREYGVYFSMLMEIMCDIEEGENFIRKEVLKLT